ncbi:hypothetical protein JSO19_01475 [Leucobacter sp. UCMA 4100]|uniref:hypothetical protein n=1 Tax=Leucobacter sp. UCMA 4100 TaxID=2810534 RepID=UPI0022EAFEE9|nr:hypothetical protein [Leucobacter sp. UCMA 4100]MDA3146045.1 hypothetical protein [Leucobacter sp. UCMA 4100]
MSESANQVRRPHGRRVGVGLALLLLASVVFGGWWSLQGQPAFAASKGTGQEYGDLGYLGSFQLASGEQAYCVEIKVREPWNPQQPVSRVDQLPSFGGDLAMGGPLGMGGKELHMPAVTDASVMRQMNYLMTKWGTTNDEAQGTAVALAMFLVRGDNIGYNEALHVALAKKGYGAIVDRAKAMVAEAKQNAIAPVEGAEVKAPVITVDGHRAGTVEFFAGTTRIELKNAVFVDTKQAAREVDATKGGKLAIETVRPKGWDASFDVEAKITWKTGRDGWRADLNLYEPTAPGEQRVVTPTGKTRGMERTGTQKATVAVKHQWAPTLSTRVHERIVPVGGSFHDSVTVAADEQFDPWATDQAGAFMPLTAHGTLYGPLESDPSEHPSADVPKGTPVAGTATLEITDGPGTYEAKADTVAVATGYYTWVWGFDWKQQPTAVTNPERTGVSSLKREVFPVRDSFGIAAETHLVQQRLTLATRLLEGTLGLGWSVKDDVAVTAEQYGGWLKNNTGTQVPVVLRGTLFHSKERPERSAQAPEDAVQIAETRLTVTEDGIYESEAVPVPLDATGFVTMQWCVYKDDQAEAQRGVVREWCDDYGVPAETAEVVPPQVTTKAQKESVEGETLHDVAIIEGPVPNEAELTFTAYLAPEAGQPRYDDDWKPTGQTWTQADLSALSDRERCLAQPVAVTPAMLIKNEGEHRSEDIFAGSVGTVHWVERLTAVDPLTLERVIVHEGECGIANETTQIVPQPDKPTSPEHPEPRGGALAATGAPNTAGMIGIGGILLMCTGILMRARTKK